MKVSTKIEIQDVCVSTGVLSRTVIYMLMQCTVI